MLRELAKEVFRDFYSNYLTVEKFAEHNQISPAFAQLIIDEGRRLHDEDALKEQLDYANRKHREQFSKAKVHTEGEVALVGCRSKRSTCLWPVYSERL
jgi:hypothetical protein